MLCETPLTNSSLVIASLSQFSIRIFSLSFTSLYFFFCFCISWPAMRAVRSASCRPSSFCTALKNLQIDGWGPSSRVCMALCHPSNLLFVLGKPSCVRCHTFHRLGAKTGFFRFPRLSWVYPLKKLLVGVILIIFGHFASSDFKVWLRWCWSAYICIFKVSVNIGYIRIDILQSIL